LFVALCLNKNLTGKLEFLYVDNNNFFKRMVPQYKKKKTNCNNVNMILVYKTTGQCKKKK